MELTPIYAALVPLVVGLVQLVKGYVAAKWVPAVALGLGVLVAFLAAPVDGWREILIAGLVMGLTAAGLYSSVRTTLAK